MDSLLTAQCLYPGAQSGQSVAHDSWSDCAHPSIRGLQTYYETLGQGEPVLLVHGVGGGSSLFQYRKNAAALAEAGFKVYALDLLGFGRSSRPSIRSTQDLLVDQLESFLKTVPQGSTAVVANGLSAAYAIRIAAEQPQLITKLVLISPTGYARLSRPQNQDRVTDFDRLRGLLGAILNAFLLDPGTKRFFLLDAYAGIEISRPRLPIVTPPTLRLRMLSGPSFRSLVAT